MKLTTILTELTAGIKATIVKVDTATDTFVMKLVLPAVQRIASKESIYYGDVATALNTKDYDVDKKVGNAINIISTLVEGVRKNETLFVSDTSLTELKTTAIGRLQGFVTITAIPNLNKDTDEYGNPTPGLIYDVKKLKELGRSGKVVIYDVATLDNAKIDYTNIPSDYIRYSEDDIERLQATNTAAAEKQSKKQDQEIKQDAEAETTSRGLKIYDPAKMNVEDPVVQRVQQAIIDKFKTTSLVNTLTYKRFISKGGADGKYGPATRDLIGFIQQTGNMADKSGNITDEFVKEIK